MPTIGIRCYLFLIAVVILIGCKPRYEESLVDIKLNSGWEFKKTSEKIWHKADVPGDIVSEMLRMKGTRSRWFLNEALRNEITASSWEYRTSFKLASDIIGKDSITLCIPVFYSNIQIFINNSQVSNLPAKCNLLYISCKKYLVVGENNLRIVFNPTDRLVDDVSALNLLNSHNVADSLKGNTIQFLWSKQKASNFEIFSSLPGIPQEPYLTAWSNAKIEDVYFYPLSISEKVAQYNAEINIQASAETEVNLEIWVDNKSVIKLNELKLKRGINKQNVSFNIPNPKLWWLNGLGSQHLYNVTFRLLSDKHLAHEMIYPLGIRKLDINYEPDSANHPLKVRFNERSVFLKGGIVNLSRIVGPQDIESKYKKIVEDAKLANINIIRILHTDFYRPELLYKLCTENGILVWQDIQLPNSNNYESSVVQAIKYLRNQSCCAIYLGKAYEGDGVTNQDDENSKFQAFTLDLEKGLPELIKRYDRHTFYWSIPDQSEQCKRYSIGKPDYTTDCLTTSFGLCCFEHNALLSYSSAQSLLSLADSLKISAGPIIQQLELPNYLNLLNAENVEFAMHVNQISNYYPNPENIQSALYLSQLHQANQLKQLYENYRINNSASLGFINLPLNDPYPSTTGTIIDYSGFVKPAFFTLKNSYTGVVLVVQKKGNIVNIFAINDELKDIDAILLCKMIDFVGKDYFVKQIPVKIGANSKVLLLTLPESELLKNLTASKVLLLVQLNQPGRTVAQNLYYFTDPKHLDLPFSEIKADINETGRGFNVILKSDVLSKNVFLETNQSNAQFSDNNIDVLPGKRYKVQLFYKGSRDELSKSLKITTLNNFKQAL